MKTIVSVNTILPTVGDILEYESGESLQDYDIVVFNPCLPSHERISMSGGGSCIDIEGTQQLKDAISHWKVEIRDALRAGKSIFVLLNEYESDIAAISSTTSKQVRNYTVDSVNNYQVLPKSIKARNAKGSKLTVKDTRFTELTNSVSEILRYKVIIESGISTKIITTKDGVSVLGGIIKIDELPGSLILFPYFDLSKMYDYDDENEEEVWTDDALRISGELVKQIIVLDKALTTEGDKTTAPSWVESVGQPKQVSILEKDIESISTKIVKLETDKGRKLDSKDNLLRYSSLLYENSKALEAIIEEGLRLLDYKVENYQKGNIEIDHIIVGPSGLRMIGESEGKDKSAIKIAKFRQLESNINEDFEREDVKIPAKGILFGNGHRFVEPSKRSAQFTDKCLTNAKRLGTALVKTTDLYEVVLHALNNPDDEDFKQACREAIEKTEGDIVAFPLKQRTKSNK